MCDSKKGITIFKAGPCGPAFLFILKIDGIITFMRILKYIVATVFIGISACALLNSAQKVMAVKNLKVTLSRFELNGVDLQGINSTVYINAENPNRVGAEIVSFDFDVLVNSEKVSKGSLRNTVIIPPHAKKTIEIPLYLPFAGMSSLVKRVLLNKSAKVGIRGYVVINTSIGTMRFKVIDRTDRIF